MALLASISRDVTVNVLSQYRPVFHAARFRCSRAPRRPATCAPPWPRAPPASQGAARRPPAARLTARRVPCFRSRATRYIPRPRGHLDWAKLPRRQCSTAPSGSRWPRAMPLGLAAPLAGSDLTVALAAVKLAAIPRGGGERALSKPGAELCSPLPARASTSSTSRGRSRFPACSPRSVGRWRCRERRASCGCAVPTTWRAARPSTICASPGSRGHRNSGCACRWSCPRQASPGRAARWWPCSIRPRP